MNLTKRRNPLIGIAIFSVLLGVFALDKLTDSNTAPEPVAEEATTPAPAPAPSIAKPAVEVGVAQMINDYRFNEPAADEKYKGAEITFHAVARSVSGSRDDFLINLGALDESGNVTKVMATAGMRSSEFDAAAKLKFGDWLTLKCVGDGFLGYAMLKDCTIVKVGP